MSGPAQEQALFDWVEGVVGGRIVKRIKASGGNRRQSWAIDVETKGGRTLRLFLRYDPRTEDGGAEPWTVAREAQVFRAIADIPIRAPQYVAENTELRAVLTDRAEGIAELRHLTDDVAKQAIACEFMDDLATLHRADTSSVTLAASSSGNRMVDHIRNELAIWEAMYREVGADDALLEFAFAWLRDHAPDPDDPPVLCHGDAGPGNFMFHDGALTAIIDWEFAHLGDPMDDLAWFSMRCVMEPVPDYFAALAAYEAASGRKIDRRRLLYHRVLVSARVVVIRHRAFAGEPAHAIVSRGLNRRLLVEALAAANDTPLPDSPPLASPETQETALYDRVIGELGDVVLPVVADKRAAAAVKNAAKVVKYLKAIDRYGPAITVAEIDALADLLGERPTDIPTGHAALCEALRSGQLAFAPALSYFAGAGARGALLSAEASGSIAHRHYIAI